MKIRFTLSRKIGLGFGILIGAILFNSVLTLNTLNSSRELNEKITQVYDPSLVLIEELKIVVINSKAFIYNWVFVQSDNNSSEKKNLRTLHDSIYPQLKQKTIYTSQNWNETTKKSLDSLAINIDSLFGMQKTVMKTLNTFDSYNDPMVVFEVRPMLDEGGVILQKTTLILKELDKLKDYFEEQVQKSSKEMLSSFDWFRNFIIITALILFISGIAITIYTISSIKKPIQYLKSILLEMAKGKLPNNLLKKSSDEIGEMSEAVDQLIESREETASFASQIGQGNLTANFTPLSKEDELGNSLLDMRSSLKKAKEEEDARKKEDQKRNWATQGIAKFAEILRNNNDNINKLSYDIIHNLVEYVDAKVGGMFILSEDSENEKYMELSASYAYDRKKYLKKKIFAGEGMVGACYQEQQTIFITDVPNNYINITSGLGGRNPRSLLIVPLKLNEEIYGVIELASFEEFDKHTISFVEKIGESIASTISSVKINMKTATLLEQSQQQAEEMRAQEEEMRQNMEELHATQEEMNRKNTETQTIVESIEQSFAVVEIDMNDNIIDANKNFFKLTSLNRNDIKSKKYSEILSQQYLQTGEYERIWKKLRRGEAHVETLMHPLRTKKIWTKETFSPIKNSQNTVYKIMCFIDDITEIKLQEQNMQHKIDELIEKLNKHEDLDDFSTYNNKTSKISNFNEYEED